VRSLLRISWRAISAPRSFARPLYREYSGWAPSWPLYSYSGLGVWKTLSHLLALQHYKSDERVRAAL